MPPRTVSPQGKVASCSFAGWACLGHSWGSAAGDCGFCLAGIEHLSSEPLSVPCLPLRTWDLQPPRVAGVGRVSSGLILAKFSVVISPHSYPLTPKKLSDFSPSLKPNHVLMPTYCSISGRLFTLIWSTLFSGKCILII